MKTHLFIVVATASTLLNFASRPCLADEPRLRATLEAHSEGVWDLAISPDGKFLASASRDKTIKLWDLSNGRNTATLKGHTDSLGALAFHPDGKILASAARDQTIKLWDITTNENTLTIPTGQREMIISLGNRSAGW